jgi:hypothetical protein
MFSRTKKIIIYTCHFQLVLHINHFNIQWRSNVINYIFGNDYCSVERYLQPYSFFLNKSSADDHYM